MVRIEWTPLAYEDLESIFKYISKDFIFTPPDKLIL